MPIRDADDRPCLVPVVLVRVVGRGVVVGSISAHSRCDVSADGRVREVGAGTTKLTANLAVPRLPHVFDMLDALSRDPAASNACDKAEVTSAGEL